MILRLAIASLFARALTVGMTVLAIALSVSLFLGVEKIRTGAKSSFADTISGTDLIVGARSGSVQLLLYSVFRIGNATNNVTWKSYQDIAARPEIEWIVPISLGDSHRQFRVSGVLEKTGTPVDRTVIVSMEAIEAIHVDWKGGAQVMGQSTPLEQLREMQLTPSAVTAALIGVKSPLQSFALQRAINEYPEEPLLAIFPGVALQELWGIVGLAETALLAVSVLVVLTALIGMMATIFSSLNERRREIAIFRAMGARPLFICGMLVFEAVVMASLGAVLGAIMLYAALSGAQSSIDSNFGIWLPIEAPNLRELAVLFIVVCAGAIVSLIPALRAYKLSVADGMIVHT